MAYNRTSFGGIWVCDTTGDKDNIPAGSIADGDVVIVKGASPKMFVKGSSVWVENEFSAASAGLPAGIILMWAGLLASIPTGWVLCDGQNGTPDLRGKFVKGSAAGVEAGAAGGALTHSHSDHATLVHGGTAVANHASHTHTYSDIVNHTHPIVDPGHTHIQNAFAPRIINSGTAGTVGVQGASAASNAAASNSATTATNQNANTGISTSNPVGGLAAGTTVGPNATLTHSVTQPSDHAAMVHSSSNHEPPFYALAFIMKT